MEEEARFGWDAILETVGLDSSDGDRCREQLSSVANRSVNEVGGPCCSTS